MGKKSKKNKAQQAQQLAETAMKEQDPPIIDLSNQQQCSWIGFWQSKGNIPYIKVEQNYQLPNFFFVPLVTMISNYFEHRSVAFCVLLARKLTFLVNRKTSESPTQRLLDRNYLTRFRRISICPFSPSIFEPTFRVGHWCGTYGIAPPPSEFSSLEGETIRTRWEILCHQAALQSNADLFQLALVSAEASNTAVRPAAIAKYAQIVSGKKQAVFSPFDFSVGIIRAIVSYFQRWGADEELETFLTNCHKALMDPASSERTDHDSFTAAIEEVNRHLDDTGRSDSVVGTQSFLVTFVKSLQKDNKEAMTQGFKTLFKKASTINKSHWSSLLSSCTTVSQYDRLAGVIPMEFQPVPSVLLFPPETDSSTPPMIHIVRGGHLSLALYLLESHLDSRSVSPSRSGQLLSAIFSSCLAKGQLHKDTLHGIRTLLSMHSRDSSSPEDQAEIQIKPLLSLFQKKNSVAKFKDVIIFFVHETEVLLQIETAAGTDGVTEGDYANALVALSELRDSIQLIEKLFTAFASRCQMTPAMIKRICDSAISANCGGYLALLESRLGLEEVMGGALKWNTSLLEQCMQAKAPEALKWVRDSFETCGKLDPTKKVQTVKLCLGLTTRFQVDSKTVSVFAELLSTLSWDLEELDPTLWKYTLATFEEVVQRDYQSLAKEFLSRYRGMMDTIEGSWATIFKTLRSGAMGEIVENYVLDPSLSTHEERRTKVVEYIQEITNEASRFDFSSHLFSWCASSLFEFFLSRGLKVSEGNLYQLAAKSRGTELLDFLNVLKTNTPEKMQDRVSGRGFFAEFLDHEKSLSKKSQTPDLKVIQLICSSTKYEPFGISASSRRFESNVSALLLSPGDGIKEETTGEIFQWIKKCVTELLFSRRDLIASFNRFFVINSPKMTPAIAETLCQRLGLHTPVEETPTRETTTTQVSTPNGIPLSEVLGFQSNERLPLTEAVKTGNEPYAKWLLRNGASPNSSTGGNDILLLLAKSYSKTQPTLGLLELLVDSKITLQRDKIPPTELKPLALLVKKRMTAKKQNPAYAAIERVMLRSKLGTPEDISEGKFQAALPISCGNRNVEKEIKILEKIDPSYFKSHCCAHRLVKQLAPTASGTKKSRAWFRGLMTWVVKRVDPSVVWTEEDGGGRDLPGVISKYVTSDPLKNELLRLCASQSKSHPLPYRSTATITTTRSKRGREDEDAQGNENTGGSSASQRFRDGPQPASTRNPLVPQLEGYPVPPPLPRLAPRQSFETGTRFPSPPPELLALLDGNTVTATVTTTTTGGGGGQQARGGDSEDMELSTTFQRSKHGRDDE